MPGSLRVVLAVIPECGFQRPRETKRPSFSPFLAPAPNLRASGLSYSLQKIVAKRRAGVGVMARSLNEDQGLTIVMKADDLSAAEGCSAGGVVAGRLETNIPSLDKGGDCIEHSMTTRNYRYSVADLPKLQPFGSVLADNISIAEYSEGSWSATKLLPRDDFSLHPGAHCLHYGSSCFEGLKAYRWDDPDDSLVVYRVDTHAKRMAQSAKTLHLPVPDPDMFVQMIQDIVSDSAESVPPAPGSLYLRPVLIGTDPNIGAASTASTSAVFYVLASPVDNYFAAGEKALRLLVEDKVPRTTPQFGCVKTGANYAAALGMTLEAKERWNVDQILFCPSGDVQETGASNFVLIDDKTLVTKPLCGSFLHGVTRDSVLTLASDLGYDVQERDFTVQDLLDWTKHGEAALSGTAAVLAGVGTLIYDDQTYELSGGVTGPNTRRLRKALVDIQQGAAADTHGWITKIT